MLALGVTHRKHALLVPLGGSETKATSPLAEGCFKDRWKTRNVPCKMYLAWDTYKWRLSICVLVGTIPLLAN